MRHSLTRGVLACAVILASGQGSICGDAPQYADRWVYCQTNLQVEKNADQVIGLIHRAAKAGYTGLVLADYKLNILDRVPAQYFRNAGRVKQAAENAKIELIPTVFPFGYSAGLLAHDPNLAEGLPVKEAPFVVKNGVAHLLSEIHLNNGSFEEFKGHRFTGLSFQDGIGKGTFADTTVAFSGKASIRFEDFTGNLRISQKVNVRPYACYRLSARVKTEGYQPKGEFKLLAIGNGRNLTFHATRLQPNQDWTLIDVVFNSLDAQEVNVYVGSWGGLAGKVWVDDWKIEELALVNVLRRAACPLVIRGAQTNIYYEEGKDFEPVLDPKLGQQPYAGEFRFDHPGATIQLTPRSRIREGEKLLVSWYHPVLIHGSQVAASLSDPKVFTIAEQQAKRVNDLLQPRTWFMSHDEIRVTGWCQDAQSSGKTPGQRLAENVRRCTDILKKISPNARIVVWSDMFDPNHNARDKYYLVNGTLEGSWEGLSKDMLIANWNGGRAAESLKFFADRGHQQILCGFYDTKDFQRGFKRWDEAARGISGIRGFMYTTWRKNFDLLEDYGRAMQQQSQP